MGGSEPEEFMMSLGFSECILSSFCLTREPCFHMFLYGNVGILKERELFTSPSVRKYRPGFRDPCTVIGTIHILWEKFSSLSGSDKGFAFDALPGADCIESGA